MQNFHIVKIHFHDHSIRAIKKAKTVKTAPFLPLIFDRRVIKPEVPDYFKLRRPRGSLLLSYNVKLIKKILSIIYQHVCAA